MKMKLTVFRNTTYEDGTDRVFLNVRT